MNKFNNIEYFKQSLQNGEKDAYEFLYTEYFKLLSFYASKIINNEEEAYDIVSTSIHKLYENRKNITYTSSIKSYLYKTVYNECLLHLRHKKVENSFVSNKVMDFYLSEVVRIDTDEYMHNIDLQKAINDAMANLPDRCRQIFTLSKIDGHSNKEISEELGTSIKTVENQMTIAFSRLRKELDWILILIFML